MGWTSRVTQIVNSEITVISFGHRHRRRFRSVTNEKNTDKRTMGEREEGKDKRRDSSREI